MSAKSVIGNCKLSDTTIITVVIYPEAWDVPRDASFSNNWLNLVPLNHKSAKLLIQ